jgi:hypothetical protein
MGEKRWRTIALDRRDWASVIREAKAKAVVVKKKKNPICSHNSYYLHQVVCGFTASISQNK